MYRTCNTNMQENTRLHPKPACGGGMSEYQANAVVCSIQLHLLDIHSLCIIPFTKLNIDFKFKFDYI